jgi:hypothetical protein
MAAGVKRPWFQIHLSTLLLLTLIMGAMWGIYVTSFVEINKLAQQMHEQRFGGSVPLSSTEAAWQFVQHCSWPGVAILVLGLLAMLALVAFVCERSIRKQEERRAAGNRPCN